MDQAMRLYYIDGLALSKMERATCMRSDLRKDVWFPAVAPYPICWLFCLAAGQQVSQPSFKIFKSFLGRGCSTARTMDCGESNGK